MISLTGLWQSKKSGNLLSRCVSSGTESRVPSFFKLSVMRDIGLGLVRERQALEWVCVAMLHYEQRRLPMSVAD